MFKVMIFLVVTSISSFAFSKGPQACGERVAAEAMNSTISFMLKNKISLVEQPMTIGVPDRDMKGIVDDKGMSADNYMTIVTVVNNTDPDYAAATRYYVNTVVKFNNKTGDCSVLQGQSEVELEN